MSKLEEIRARNETAKEEFLAAVKNDVVRGTGDSIGLATIYPSVWEDVEWLLSEIERLNKEVKQWEFRDGVDWDQKVYWFKFNHHGEQHQIKEHEGRVVRCEPCGHAILRRGVLTAVSMPMPEVERLSVPTKSEPICPVCGVLCSVDGHTILSLPSRAKQTETWECLICPEVHLVTRESGLERTFYERETGLWHSDERWERLVEHNKAARWIMEHDLPPSSPH